MEPGPDAPGVSGGTRAPAEAGQSSSSAAGASSSSRLAEEEAPRQEESKRQQQPAGAAAGAGLVEAPAHQPQPLAQQQPAAGLSRYESQKRRDWNTFLQYLRNHRPPLTLQRCSGAHVIEFLQYIDQFGKTKVHVEGCAYFGQPNPPASCACPQRQAWGSLDALIGRLRAAYEESGGRPESNPFAARAVRFYLIEVREAQAKARGIPNEKKRKRGGAAAPPHVAPPSVVTAEAAGTSRGGEEEEPSPSTEPQQAAPASSATKTKQEPEGSAPSS